MKIFLPNESRQTVGGGWSFIHYFKKGMGDRVTEDYNQADVVFLVGASLAKPEIAEQAKKDGKKIILRCDNFLKHSRNQGKGMARMQRMAAVADLVIYQCQWAKDILDDFLGHPKSTIIYNGVDLDIFRPDGDTIRFDTNNTYLYASASKGENKGWNTCWYEYQEIQKKEPDAMLLIAGKVSTEVMNYGFDFFQGERYQYLGMITEPQRMATIYRSSRKFFCVAQYDCYSNAALEAALCGCEWIRPSMTGGMPELLANLKKGRDFNGIPRMVSEYEAAISRL